MSDLDISKKAVEKWCDQQGVLLTDPPQEPQSVQIVRAQAARLERLEAALTTIRDNKVKCPRAADCRAVAEEALKEEGK